MPLEVKNPPANAGDTKDVDLIPGLGRSPGEENDNQLQYSCLETPLDRGTWWVTIHRVAKSQTRLSSHTHTHTHTHTQSCDYHPGHLATRSLVPIQPRNAVFRDCDYGLELSWETKWRHLDLPHLADKIWGDLLVIDGPCIALIVHDSPEIVTAKMEHEKWSFHSVNSSAPISHDGGHLCVMTHTLQGCFLLSESMWPEKEAIAQELFSRLHIKSKVKLQFDWLFHSNCSIFKKWHNYLGRVM